MVKLVLLNGPPGVGKSTLARRVAAQRPGALALDIDVVRSMIGGWRSDPNAAGLAARRLAISMIREHLASGFDVFVPQFLGRLAFIEELEAAAAASGARFIEVALMMERAEAIEAFRSRAASSDQTHRDAAALVAAASDEAGDDSVVLGEMYGALLDVIEARPATHIVDVARGDVDATMRAVDSALAAND